MIKKLFIPFYTFLLYTSVQAQKSIPGFGKIDAADLLLKACPFEPDAPAMKLLDVLDIDFHISPYEARIKTERRVRIKVFNEKGYPYTTIRIPYFSKKGIAKIKELSGVIYNFDANGKVIIKRLEKKDFFKEKAVENIGIVNFTFPNVKPGSVIEYSYTTIENDIISISPWIIQGEIPVAYSLYILTTPVESKAINRMFATDTVESNYFLLKYDQFRRTFYSKKNVPSFHREQYMTSYKDNLMRCIFKLFPLGGVSFGNMSDAMWRSAGLQFLQSKYIETQIGKTIPGTEKIIDTANKISSLTDRIGFVYDAVQKKWAGRVEQTTKLEDLSEAWTSGSASSAEINLILLNLLEKANIKCIPVLVSTRNNGFVDKTFPSLGQFDGVDVMAFDSTKYYFLDASIKFQSFQNPPLNVLNREALVLSPDSIQWATISDNRPLLKQSSDVYADLNENGTIEGTATVQYFDYAKSYKLDTTLLDDEREEKFMDKKPLGLKILASKQENSGIADDPLFETIDFTYEPQNTGDFYFIDPQILTAKNKNPFLSDKRITDLDFGCNQMFVLNMQIHFPSSFQAENLPKNMTIRAPDSSFFYKVTYTADKENVYMSQLFEIKRAMFSKDEYPGIQDFFKRMYGLMAEEIILKKKK